MEFKLPYWVSNGGDGSANVDFASSLAEAEKLDADQSEGWGESSAGTIKLKVTDGKLFFWGYPEDDPDDDGPYVAQWIEVLQQP